MSKVPTLFAIVLAFVGMATMPASAQRTELNSRRLAKCMHVTVLQRGSADGLDFDGHGFNCHGLKGWKTSHGITAVRGQLSHRLTARKDDQVNFSFKIYPDGAVDDMKIHIDRGGFVRTYVDPWLGSGISLKSLVLTTPQQVMDLAGRLLDGSWEGTARALVTAIAGNLGYARRVAVGRQKLARDSRVRYYNIAPRPAGPERIQHARNEAACRQQCAEWRTCEVWSFQNRRKSDGKPGERWCKLYQVGRYNGFRAQTRSITGRVRDLTPTPQRHSTATVHAATATTSGCDQASEPKVPEQQRRPATSRPGYRWVPGHNRCVNGKWQYLKPAWVRQRAH